MGKDLKGKELGKGLSQRKDGRYCGRYTDRFGIRKSIYENTLKGLRNRINEALYENDKKLNVIDDKITLNQWFEIWRDVYKKPTVRATTLINYINIYEVHVKPVLGAMKLRNINTTHVQMLLNSMLNRGFKHGMIMRVRVTLADIFNKAILSELTAQNPARKTTLPKPEKEEPRILTLEEQIQFLDYAKNMWYETMFQLALLTGLRCRELCALTWDDIDFEKRSLHVNKTLTYFRESKTDISKYGINPPKTQQSRRMIPLSNEAVYILKKHKEKWIDIMKKSAIKKTIPGFENQVFMNRNLRPVSEILFNNAIKKVILNINQNRKDGEPEFESISPHTFRHTFATQCFENGMQPKVLQILLGHSTLDMTMNLYTHVTDEQKEKEALKMICIGIKDIGVKMA